MIWILIIGFIIIFIYIIKKNINNLDTNNYDLDTNNYDLDTNNYECNKCIFETFNSFNPIIWLLWFQGWDNAPQLVLQVRDSWLYHNPDADIRLLDEKEIKKYTDYQFPDDAKLPAKSDILRIILLKKYGGIWVDATMLCLDSLDKWISNVETSKFWMYHGRNNACTFTLSQLIISYPNEYIINKWYDKVIDFWSVSRTKYEYNWLDLLFHDLYNSNLKFKELIDKIPNVKCEPEYIHNYLQTIVYEYNLEKIEEIISKKPYFIKLNHYGKLTTNTNAWAMIEYAFIRK